MCGYHFHHLTHQHLTHQQGLSRSLKLVHYSGGHVCDDGGGVR